VGDHFKNFKQEKARLKELWNEALPKVGQTPRMSIWNKNKATLWYYPATNKKFQTPLFLIYSLLNQPYILDLGPGLSMIEAFMNEGYDVYLLDFGIPGYEDKDFTLDYYIINYIETAVQRALRHSNDKSISVIGYCLGGTLATIFTSVTNIPIKNLILIAAPIDFSQSPQLTNWVNSLKNGELSLDELIDEYGLIPAKLVELSMKMMTSPISYSPYINLLTRAHDEKYVVKWLRFQQWVKGHIPFVGATLKQILNDLLKENKLINNKLIIQDRKVKLSHINSNLLVVSTSGDQIIPEELIKPIMNKVASNDKTYLRVKGGHVTLAIKGEIPEYLSEWIQERSSSI
jgi:polyhydroxyalkanoate synthase subunit PhaC